MRHSRYAIRHGTKSKLMFVYGRDPRDPHQGAVGLSSTSGGGFLAYMREGESRPNSVELVAGRLGDYTRAGFVEVDSKLLPGLYQLGVPDEVLAEGAPCAYVRIAMEGALFDLVEVALVAYDPQDPERMGVEGLANSRRHEFLRRALPRLTEMELALGATAERELRARLAEEAATPRQSSVGAMGPGV